MRILVTGSRDWTDRTTIRDVLGAWALSDPCNTVIHGGCRGADMLADEIARDLECHIETYPVSTDLDGPWPGAGPRRNARMLRESKPDIVIAFPIGKSKGTRRMIELAKKAGVQVFVYEG